MAIALNRYARFRARTSTLINDSISDTVRLQSARAASLAACRRNVHEFLFASALPALATSPLAFANHGGINSVVLISAAIDASARSRSALIPACIILSSACARSRFKSQSRYPRASSEKSRKDTPMITIAIPS